MKKTFAVLTLSAAMLLSGQAVFAQSPIQNALTRFTDPEKGHTVFIDKGHYALGIAGSYHSFSAGGDGAVGYSILSFLNIGNGRLALYEVTPSFSYFLADDLSLGVRLDYDGFTLDTDLRANLGELFNFSGIIDMVNAYSEEEGNEGSELEEQLYDLMNLRISGRHMVYNSWGTSFALRKYMSFFGSKTFAVFGEARLYGKYGRMESCPIDKKGVFVESKMRTSDIYSVGLKMGAGLAVRLRDNSAITIGLPIVGVTYSYTRQHKETKSGANDAHMSQFNISRDIDLMALQVGYTHYIRRKK